MAEKKLVLSVGQCGYDNSRLRSLIQSIRPDLTLMTVDTATETLNELQSQSGQISLILINRLFDTDGGSGLDLIRAVSEQYPAQHPPLMLVSNYEDAQATAIAHGALPGFGKSELSSPRTAERIKAALGE